MSSESPSSKLSNQKVVLGTTPDPNLTIGVRGEGGLRDCIL